MFENLSRNFSDVFGKLKRRGHLTEKDVDEALREIRKILLEADVNYLIAKNFCENVKEKAVGEKVLKSLSPGDVVSKIVFDEMKILLGSSKSDIRLSGNPSVIMLAGLQGSGKTTTCAKLGVFLKNKGIDPVLSACDVKRPAASKQLQLLCEKYGLSFSPVNSDSAVKSVEDAMVKARKEMKDAVILDTAGRLHIDSEMIEELKEIKEKYKPNEILLVVDAMTGQDAWAVSKSFKENIDITGIVLTKMDGDARGGAALSMRVITGMPVKFVGTGEKAEDFSEFYPDRMASRITGFGDIVSLVEKVKEAADAEETKKMAKKMEDFSFTLEDFLSQLKTIKKMGPLENILSMMPGNIGQNVKIDENEISKIEAIIFSMTPQERKKPEIINASRKKRIAMGSGTKVGDVAQLIKQFETSKKMLKQLSGRGIFSKMPMTKNLTKKSKKR
ncbi:signal recognition particle protein [candidate division WOR-3 bacterium]|nr:signal recognition particle protein [candidate division WOR-3 bacterium]